MAGMLKTAPDPALIKLGYEPVALPHEELQMKGTVQTSSIEDQMVT